VAALTGIAAAHSVQHPLGRHSPPPANIPVQRATETVHRASSSWRKIAIVLAILASLQSLVSASAPEGPSCEIEDDLITLLPRCGPAVRPKIHRACAAQICTHTALIGLQKAPPWLASA